MKEQTLIVKELSVSESSPQRPKRLANVSFQLPQGGITLVIGQTGAGKSTLLQVLGGLEPPSEGNVFYGDTPFWSKRVPNPGLMRRLGFVFQYPEHQLFAQTVRREFNYSLKPYDLPAAEIERRIQRALTAVNFNSAILDEFPLTLSGGQKRRIALAATLATEPEWLFLDEPTAGLDSKAAAQFVNSLEHFVATPGRAALVATHDLDRFLPVAQKVLILNAGQLMNITTPAQLMQSSEILREAGIGLPSSVELFINLNRCGIRLSSPSFSVHEMAAQLAAHGSHETASSNSSASSPSSASSASSRSVTNVAAKAVGQQGQNHAIQASAIQAGAIGGNSSKDNTIERHAEGGFDVRAKWVFYVLISIGILVQTSWTGVFAASVMAFGTVLLARVDLRRLWRVLRPFLYLAALSVLLAGLQISVPKGGLWHLGVGFSGSQAIVTLMQTWKLWLMLMLGVWFASSSSQLEMKQSLEQAFGGLSRIGIPIEAFALGTALLLRFIPVLGHEQQRFARITKARGKSGGRPDQLRLRDLPAFTIPLILSLFQLGEDLSLAMEARGCTHVGRRARPLRLPKLQRKDVNLILLGVILLALLWFFRSLH